MELFPNDVRPVRTDVLVVIVAYNSEAVLSRCVIALGAAADRLRTGRGAGTALVLVDNASQIPASVPEVGLEVRCIRLTHNLGFAPAANLGAEQGRSSLILFLNPDAELDPAALLRLVEEFDQPETAIAGPLLVRDSGEAMLSERPFHTLRREFGTQLLPFRRRRPFGRDALATGRARCLSGACLLVERDFFESVGGFDVAVRMYLEDVELCWRARVGSRQVRFVPAARCNHRLGASSRGESFDSRLDLHLTLLGARVEFVRRRSGALAAGLMRTMIAMGAIGRTLVGAALGRGWRRHVRVLLWATVDGSPPQWESIPWGARNGPPPSTRSRLREDTT